MLGRYLLGMSQINLREKERGKGKNDSKRRRERNWGERDIIIVIEEKSKLVKRGILTSKQILTERKRGRDKQIKKPFVREICRRNW